MAYVTVDVELNEFDDEEIVAELEHRGYYVSKDTPSEGFDREDWQFLLDLLDKQPETWYTRSLREKLSEARFQ
jgi:hypothetical protein